MASKQKLTVSSKPQVVGVVSRRRKIILGTAAALAVLALIVQSMLFYDLYQRAHLQNEEGAQIKMLIARAVDGLPRDAVIEGPTNTLYFPENRLSMQAVLHSPRLQYAPNDDGLQLAQKNVVNVRVSRMMGGQNTTEAFDRVPAPQACSHQFQIQFVQMSGAQMKDGNLLPVATKRLADGRTAYVYRDLGCDDSGELVLPMFDSLQSY